MEKILFVVTSHAEFDQIKHRTGVWLEEYAVPFMHLRQAGYMITVASPKGGTAPVDPASMPDKGYCTDRFIDMIDQYKAEMSDAEDQLNQTEKLSELKADDFAAVYYPGGHGCLWDVTVDPVSIDLLEQFVLQNKPVMAICHACAILAGVNDSNGMAWIAGRPVTGFSNAEEDLLGLTSAVPYSVENRLIEAGALYTCLTPGSVCVLEDGMLITGQNSVSSYELGKKALVQLDQLCCV